MVKEILNSPRPDPGWMILLIKNIIQSKEAELPVKEGIKRIQTQRDGKGWKSSQKDE